MKKLGIIVYFGAIFLFQCMLHAQQVDAAFGVGTLIAPSASSASGDHSAVSMTGGAYPAVSFDVLLKHNFGVGGEVAWRASRSNYILPATNQPYRPLLYDVNAIYAPKLSKHLTAEVMGGIGWESIRFYQGFTTCGAFSCTDFFSSNHFLGHFGGGLRYYVWGHLFVRPEAHLYLVNNNLEFSSPRSARFGVSIGYTFAPGF